jgi:hypothetical protein
LESDSSRCTKNRPTYGKLDLTFNIVRSAHSFLLAVPPVLHSLAMPRPRHLSTELNELQGTKEWDKTSSLPKPRRTLHSSSPLVRSKRQEIGAERMHWCDIREMGKQIDHLMVGRSRGIAVHIVHRHVPTILDSPCNLFNTRHTLFE